LKICINCFRKIQDDAKFCSYCGYPQESAGVKRCPSGHLIFEDWKDCPFCAQSDSLGKTIFEGESPFMGNNKTIAVVVPVYNEESQIIEVLKSIPDFVDRIIVVNDGSTDKTSIKIKNYIMNNHQKIKPIFRVNPKNASVNSKYNYADVIAMKMREKEEKYYVPLKSKFIRSESKVILLEHEYNAGVGAAITTGYKWCRDHGIDCVAVMAGDGQMDPSELKSICEPIIKGEADYVKGNRFIHRAAPLIIPKIRYIGNSILSILTKIASGYWHISDTQCGYTAISHKALEGLELYKIYKSFIFHL